MIFSYSVPVLLIIALTVDLINRRWKWGLLSFIKKSKSSINLEKGTEGVMLSEDGINHLTQLIDYLSKEQSK